MPHMESHIFPGGILGGIFLIPNWESTYTLGVNLYPTQSDSSIRNFPVNAK